MRVLLTQSTPLTRQVRRTQAMTLSTDRDLLTGLLGDHPRTRQDNQEEEDLWASRRLGDPLVLHLKDRLVGTREVPLGRHRRHHLLRPRRTLHRVLQQSLRSLLYQHPHTKRNPMSRHRRISLRQRSGIVSDDKPSSTLRKIDEISTMTKRLFDSC
jgi:hypothetical protein